MQAQIVHNTEQGSVSAVVGEELTEEEMLELRTLVDAADFSAVTGPLEQQHIHESGNAWLIKITDGQVPVCEGKIPVSEVLPPLQILLDFILLYGNREIATQAACERLHLKLCRLPYNPTRIRQFSSRLIKMIDIGRQKGDNSLARMRRETDETEKWLDSTVSPLERAIMEFEGLNF